MAKGAMRRPYWLEDGEETCESCTHTFVVQVVVRCSGCDAAGCAECVVRNWVSHEVLCSECRQLEGAE
jgi:hypothetical protein